MNAKQIMHLLQLKPLPVEGGYYRETFRSKELISKEGLPERYKEEKLLYSTIYYLITPDSWSAMHRLPSDEIFHFYLGDPVEVFMLSPDGNGKVELLGNQLLEGQRPQLCVPRFTWQASKLAEGGTFALLGTTMAPGFTPSDFTAADTDALRKAYPKWKNWIDRY